MPLTNFASNVSDVLKIARTYLNDDNATVWTDPILIPKIQEAYRELQTMLWEIGSPVVRAVSSPSIIGIGQVSLEPFNYFSGNQDMVCPFKLMEASNPPVNDWTPMTEVANLTELLLRNVTPINKIVYWAWNQEILFLNPCTVQRQVIVSYRANLGDLNTAADAIRVLGGELYLATRSAAIAAGASGNKEVYDAMTALSKENFQRVVFANRGQQKPVNRP